MADVSDTVERLKYVRERKHFLNQKVYDVFEKFQIVLLTYLGYALLIFVGSLKGDYDRSVSESLLALSHNVLAVFVGVFVIFMTIIISEWRKYEREENFLSPSSTSAAQRKWWVWVETWMIAIGIFEYFAMRWLIEFALVMV